MNFFGLQIPLILALQILMTAIVITFYTILLSLQEAKADQLNSSYMILLLSFVMDNHPEMKSLADVADIKQEALDELETDINWLSRFLTEYRDTGKLPPLSKFQGSTLLENLVAMLLAPLVGPLLTIWRLEVEKKYKISRVTHTEIRKNFFSKFTFLLAVNLFVVVLSLLFLVPRFPRWGYALVILTSISSLACLVGMSAYVWWQMNWKDYWQDKLLEVMAVADKKRDDKNKPDHDLFNRAMILRNYIQSEPDIPIPGSLGFYTIVYSGVQGFLFLVFHIIHRTA